MRKHTLTAILLAFSALARAEVPVAINFSGCLEGLSPEDAKNAQDAPSVLMEFRLYAEPGTGGASEKARALWGRQATVALDKGFFDVELSDSLGTPLKGLEDASLASAIGRALDQGDGSSVWIGLTPKDSSHDEIFPRQRVDTVVRAVQAQNVRSVPARFEVARQLTVDPSCPLEVTGTDGAATMKGPVEYGTVDFQGPMPAFSGGLAVTGTLSAASLMVDGPLSVSEVRAGSVDASAVKATVVTVANTATWSVTNALLVTTGRVENVEKSLVADGMTVETLDVKALTNQTSLSRNANWSPIGGLYQEQNISQRLYTSGGSLGSDFEFCSSKNFRKDSRKAVCAGSWTAPRDCIAYFTVYLSDVDGKGACVQFYFAKRAGEEAFFSREPCALASCEGKGRKLQTVVPVVMSAGQVVQWLGNNRYETVDKKIEPRNSCVIAISYRVFGWMIESK